MNTDRELLELAAKAAGMKSRDQWAFDEEWGLKVSHGAPPYEWWNPLADDGDALRLAVQLGMCVTIFMKDHDTMVGYPRGEHDGANVIEPHNNDPYVATRRAIVRAAAEIGRAML